MNNIIRKTIAVLLAAGVLFGCAACGSSETDPDDIIPESTGGKDVEKAPAADDVFSLNYNSKYSFNPVVATNHANQLVCNLVYENMVELDNDFNVTPGVITSWSYTDGGKVWTLNVDTERTFHDGTNIQGKDVRYSLERAISSDRYSGRFASVQGVSYSDDTVYVTLGIGDTQFIKLLNIGVIKNGTANDTYPMGSGPYTFSEDGTKLLAWEGNGYHDLPFDEVYLVEYTEQAEIIEAFEDSYIDAIFNDPSSYSNPGYASSNEFRQFATTNMHYIAFNEESMLGKYTNFRIAMEYAFDRSYLVEDMMHGYGVEAVFPMYPTCDAYPTALAETYGYDLDTVVQILDNFGIRDYDDDGKLEFMNGSPQEIDINFVLCSDSSAKNGMATKFQEDMASIGITVTINALSWDDFLVALEEGDFDMYYAEVKLRNNFDVTELLQVRPNLKEGETTTNINYTNSTDTSYEYYIQQYLAAEESNRAYQYQAFCKYLGENATIITLAFENQELITHRGVIKGLDPNMGNLFYGLQDWVVDLG